MGSAEAQQVGEAMKYRKVDPRIWNDAKFMALSHHAKLVFFMLLTHPHLTMVGAMRGSVVGLAAELNVSVDVFDEILNIKLAEYDASACFIWLPNFIKYNVPESPNVVRAWGSAFDLLPECELKNKVFQTLASYAEGLGKGFAEAFREAFTEASPKALAKTSPNQEQEQEQEQKEERTSVKSTDAAKAIRSWFDAEFWPAYPRKIAKAAALKVVERIKPDDSMRTRMVEAVKRQATSAQWTKDGGQFIPHASTWLNQRRWDDEPELPVADSRQSASAAEESTEDRIRRQDANPSFFYTYRCATCGEIHGRKRHNDPKVCEKHPESVLP